MLNDENYDEILEAAARLTPQWLAGFFDGEGCVITNKRKHNLPYGVIVQLTQKDAKLLALIALRFPGAVGPHVNNWGANRSNCYYIKWHGRFAIPFLEVIKDHVIVKRKQVGAGLELAKLTKPKGWCGGVTEREASRREELAGIVYAANAESRNA